MNTCTIEGCDKPVRSARAQWCKMHYHRWYRHGDPLVTFTHEATGSPRTYRVVACKGHPIVMNSGRQYEHRVVLYDAIGGGSHACHWCGVEVHWKPEPGQRRLDVDHLDGVKHHNTPDNLVPSCTACNTSRAVQHRRQELAVRGAWAHHDTVGALAERVTDTRRFVA